LFGFAGFYSKDMILESAWADHSAVGQFAFWIGLFAALLTAFYSWRLLLMTFHGAPRADHHVMEHAHESPRVMLWPLYILAAGSIFAGLLFYPYFVGEEMEAFWREAIFVLPENNTIEGAHHTPFLIGLSPVIAGLIGIALAYLFYSLRPDLPQRIARSFRGLHLFLLNKWYFDELFDAIFVRPAQYLGFGLWQGGDRAIIDGLGPDGIAATTRDLARRASRLQTGYLYHYAFVMLIGVVILVSWYMFMRAR
jgi:NADH-quinone oxidoreductase subunit L